jgi:UDP-glucose 4-epimerase
MNVLVTGATGFLGAATCRSLIAHDHQVVPVAPPWSRQGEELDRRVIRVDLREPGALERACTVRPDAVVHLAAVVPSVLTGREAAEAAACNEQIDRSVFAACQVFGVGVVYASSTSVYGVGSGAEITEASAPRPNGPYAEAKQASERDAQALSERHSLPCAVLRISAPYGPGQRRRTVVKLFIERALGGLPLLYHGTGSREQDFTHAEDIAEAIRLALERRASGVYTIASGRPISMKQLAALVVRCVPRSASSVGPSGAPDPQESATARFAIRKAAEDLGWRPAISLEAGIRAWAQSLASERHENRVAV